MSQTGSVRRALAVLAAVAATTLVSGCGGDDSPSSEPAAQDTAEDTAEGTPGTPQAVVLMLDARVATKCIMPNAKTLSGFTEAFDGTVTKVDGNEATLDVDHWYAGGDDAPQVVVHTVDRQISEAGLFELEEGKRYLISGQEGGVSLCGFSAAWSPDLERLYQQAFGG